MGFACGTNPVWGHPCTVGHRAACPNTARARHGLLPHLSSSPSSDVCLFLPTSAVLGSQPLCCAHISQRTFYLLQHPFVRANSCHLPCPSAPLCSHSTPRLLFHPRCQPHPHSTGHNNLYGTWIEDGEIAASWSASSTAPCIPRQGANPPQLSHIVQLRPPAGSAAPQAEPAGATRPSAGSRQLLLQHSLQEASH